MALLHCNVGGMGKRNLSVQEVKLLWSVIVQKITKLGFFDVHVKVCEILGHFRIPTHKRK